jgi:hypothetical protein
MRISLIDVYEVVDKVEEITNYFSLNIKFYKALFVLFILSVTFTIYGMASTVFFAKFREDPAGFMTYFWPFMIVKLLYNNNRV